MKGTKWLSGYMLSAGPRTVALYARVVVGKSRNRRRRWAKLHREVYPGERVYFPGEVSSHAW